MSAFIQHTLETAPEGAKAQLAAIEKAWSFIPNLHRTLAESPETLEGYDTLFGLVAKTTLTAAEQQVVYLAINWVNECEYCMAGHSVLAAGAKVPADVIHAVREHVQIADVRLEALRRFAQYVVVQRGNVGEGEVQRFLGAGFSKRNVLEVILAVATKTISNYVNHIAGTPNDAFMKDTAWVAPSKRIKAA